MKDAAERVAHRNKELAKQNALNSGTMSEPEPVTEPEHTLTKAEKKKLKRAARPSA